MRMKIFSLIKSILSKPSSWFFYANNVGLFKFLSDEHWCKLMWWNLTGKRLNLEDPKGFNEKLQWIKLYDRKPLYTQLADKYAVREFVANKIGEEYLIPLLGVWDNADDIDFEALPAEFVLKCTHNSNKGLYLCHDKRDIDEKEVRTKLNKVLRQKYYLLCREWPYKNIKPRIVCEKFMHDECNPNGSLTDYKIFCFNGEPKFLNIGLTEDANGRKGTVKMIFLDLDFNVAPFQRSDHKIYDAKFQKPKNWDEMLRLTRILSEGFYFIRVDLYSINNHVYFSELTFFPGSGTGFFTPEEYEYKIGQYLVLPTKTNK